MPDNTTQNQRTGFKPGQSGNPKGKPKGCRHKATMAAQALLDGEGEALTRKAVELALEGDTVALRLCLERICPPRKDSPILIVGLPKVEKLEDLAEASAIILDSVAGGLITPSEGQTLCGLLEYRRRVLEIVELESRIKTIESKI